MKTLKTLISEGISPIVYHSTDLNKVKSILKSNKFKLVTDLGTTSEITLRSGKDKFYYLSTTRHKLGGYSLEPYKKSVMLVLDGKKLAQNYSGKAVDYWGPDFRKIEPTKAEAEDRVFSRKPFIPNAKKYIKEIHVLYIADGTDGTKRISMARKSIIEMKKSGIPLYIYNDTQNFLIQNKRKAVDLDTEVFNKSNTDKPFRSRSSFANDVTSAIELYHKKDEKKLSKDANNLLYRMKYYSGDALNSLRTAIANDNRSDNKVNKQINSLVKIMRKLKLRTIKQFVIHMQNKWIPVTEQEEINELFNSGIKFTEKKTFGKRSYEWNINGKKFTMVINKRTQNESWAVIFFGEDKYGFSSTLTTDEGDEFKVFSTVVNILKTFVKKEKPLAIDFTGKAGPRSKLYDRMIKRFAKGYEVKTAHFGADVEYKLTKKGV